MLAANAADLEDIGKVAGEGERQRQLNLLRAVIGKCDPLAQGPVAQVDRPPDVHRVFEKNDAIACVNVGIGQIDIEAQIVVPDGGAQQEGRLAVDQQLQAGEEACV